jgi:hypothetical protein
MTTSVLMMSSLLASVAPTFAVPGDSVLALKDYAFGPVMYLVIALGMLGCLYQFARGDKSSALYILGALLFIASARSLIPAWFGSENSGQGLMSMGDFPYYGSSPAVQVPGEVQAYDDLKSWGFIGLTCCHSIISLLFGLGIPVIIASVGAMVTFHRLVAKKQTGSVVGYFLICLFVGTFCLFPLVSFTPANLAQIQGNDVITSLNAANISSPSAALTNPESMSIPLLPALLLSGGVDLTEAIGTAINAQPASSYPTQILTAARHAALPEQWFSAYADYSVQCAAAQQGFVNAEPTNPTALFSQARWHDAISQTVSSASLNLLSSWGDAMMALIPLHGYVINDRYDMQVESTRDANQIGLLANAWKWVPADLSEQAEIATVLDHSHINSGLPGGLAVGYKPLRTLQTPDGMPVWTLPKGRPTPDLPTAPGAVWMIPYCSVPDDAFSTTGMSLSVDRTNGAHDAVTNWAVFSSNNASYTNQSAYLTEMAQAVALPLGPDQSYSVTLIPYDWGEELRSDLLQQFDTPQCLSACGNPSHKFFWGCMVTGAFIQIANSTPNICDTSADTTRAFFGQAVAGISYANYVQLAANGYYQTYPVKARSVDDLTSGVLSGTPISSASLPARRAAVDAIIGAPGTFAQNSLARDANSFPSESGGQFSLWNFFERLPQMALWLLGLFASIAAMLISFLWPHFMGIVMLLFLLFYPLFACLALWPSKWMLLLEWARGLLWVLMWAPISTLGYSLINSGSYLTQDASFLSATPGPGQTLLTLVGVAMILMAPAIAQAILTPSFSSLCALGTAVYSTGFKVLGIATQLVGALAGISTGALGAGIGAGIGLTNEAAHERRQHESLRESTGDGERDARPSTAHDRFAHVAASAAAGGRLGLAAARHAQHFASQAMTIAEACGAEGLGDGAKAGEAMGRGIYSAAQLSGRTILSGARFADRHLTSEPAPAKMEPLGPLMASEQAGPSPVGAGARKPVGDGHYAVKASSASPAIPEAAAKDVAPSAVLVGPPSAVHVSHEA